MFSVMPSPEGKLRFAKNGLNDAFQPAVTGIIAHILKAHSLVRKWLLIFPLHRLHVLSKNLTHLGCMGAGIDLERV